MVKTLRVAFKQNCKEVLSLPATLTDVVDFYVILPLNLVESGCYLSGGKVPSLRRLKYRQQVHKASNKSDVRSRKQVWFSLVIFAVWRFNLFPDLVFSFDLDNLLLCLACPIPLALSCPSVFLITLIC